MLADVLELRVTAGWSPLAVPQGHGGTGLIVTIHIVPVGPLHRPLVCPSPGVLE